jgi:predicted TIM-barrel fold metal-dependent hydrolase
VRLLDEAGIRQALVLSLAYQYGNPNRPPVENEYDQVKAENDWTSAQVARFPDRLRGFCSVNPLKDSALEEIARCAKDPWLARSECRGFSTAQMARVVGTPHLERPGLRSGNCRCPTPEFRFIARNAAPYLK